MPRGPAPGHGDCEGGRSSAMTMLAFHALFPEQAESEYRTVLPMNDGTLPSHAFVIGEAYCVAPRCDCRRVILNVIDTETQTHAATINYAFEPPESDSEDEGQIFLDRLNPQSELSEALLAMFQKLIAYDRGYHNRLVRHYEMGKRVVGDPTHPAQEAIHPAATGSAPVRGVGPERG